MKSMLLSMFDVGRGRRVFSRGRLSTRILTACAAVAVVLFGALLVACDGSLGGSEGGNPEDNSPAATLATPTALNEDNLDTATVTVTLTNTEYVTTPALVAANFTLTDTVDGEVTAIAVARTGATTAMLTLEHDGTDITANGTLTITVAADAHADTGALTAGSVPIRHSCDDTLIWNGIVPDCLAPGDTYRILFVTAGERRAGNDDITVYNSFAQEQADTATGAPLSSITFRALGSTAAVDARDNTDTRPTADNSGERIFYFRGAKVADDYIDLYNGDWDSNEPTDQNGDLFSTPADDLAVWTGSETDGTEGSWPMAPQPSAALGATELAPLGGGLTTPRPQVLIGLPKSSAKEISAGSFESNNSRNHLYALSAVLTTPDATP